MPLQTIKTAEQVPLNKISETEQKVRRETADKGIGELAASLRKHGQIHAISLLEETDGSNTIIQGHRRFTAARREGMPSLRANIYRVPDGEEADRDRLIQEHLYAANMAEPLIPVEKARMFEAVMDEFGFSVEQVAECFEGETPESVLETLKYKNIDNTVLDILAANPDTFTSTHLKVLAEFASPSQKYAWRMKPDEQIRVTRELVDQVDKRVNTDARAFERRIKSVVRERRDREQAKNTAKQRAHTDPVKSLFKVIEVAQTATKGFRDFDLTAIKEIDPGDKGAALKMLYDIIEEMTVFIDDGLTKLPSRKAAAS